MDARAVLRALEEMSGRLQPGDALPTQLELSRLFNASDRAVRWALDELRREGHIISRRRVGTIVAERNRANNNGHLGNTEANASFAEEMVVNSRTIVAIAVPGQSVLSRALNLLFQQTQIAEYPLVCRFFDPQTPAALHLPSARPLGYILVGRELFTLGRQLQEVGQRVVVMGTPPPDVVPEVACVLNDQEHGGYLATRHLLDLGHRHIAFRGIADWAQMRRWQGHQQALAEAKRQGVEVTESLILDDLYEQWRRTPELATAYFRRVDAPTAIIAWNDQTAMSLLSLLSYINIRVPNDISLMGYDNLPESQQVHPALTTIDVGVEHQMRAAVRMLTQSSPLSPSQTVIVPSTLMCRESTSSPPQS